MSAIETQSLVEGALISALTVVLALLAFLLPIVGTFMTLLLPIPIIVLSVRRGTKISILSTVLTALILGMIINPTLVLVTLTTFGLIGVVLGAAFEEEFTPLKLIISSAVVFLISTVLTFGISFYLLNFNPLSLAAEAMEQTLDLYRNLGIDGSTIEDLEAIFANAEDLIRVTLPALLIVSSTILGYINYYISYVVLQKLDYNYQAPPAFVEWRFPKYLFWGYLGGLIFIGTSIGQNIYIVFQFIFLIQGLAVIAHYLNKFNIASKLQKLILALLIILPIGHFISILGALDVWFDYRKLEN
ncbi:YybS family protein [Fuchsiella alkaliacetigena]|uniref:YybS family protein n=1 Tax=Fuchsiella alkaliacetigena TaxID=957042 RepID=UPI00200A9089|nr:YybS family protein [Fuchsiella alkaliacetigena]MCK8824552.1 YybS family protein [Fuchsiella alkaliacetigena]